MSRSANVTPWSSVLARALPMSAGAALFAALASGASGPSELDGVWRSRGYGTVITVAGERGVLYDINRVVCAKRGERNLVELFRNPQRSADGRSLTTLSVEGLTIIYYERIAALPPICAARRTKDPRDPLYNFDAFWSWFDEHYAFFSRRAVDWKHLRERYRPRITRSTTDAELLEVFRSILRQLQDHHVALSGEGFYYNAGMPPLFVSWFDEHAQGKNRLPPFGDFARMKARELLRASWKRYLDRGSLQELSLNLTSGTLGAGRIGFLAVSAEAGYSDVEEFEAEIAAARDALRQAFTLHARRDALVLDVRINFGGHDDVALLLAGLLTSADRRGFSKCTRDGPGYTPVQRTTVRAQRNAFTGPVVILSSQYNASAGENFIMMAKDFPNVLIVGDRSAGVHSDTLHKTLPNGWGVNLSNEVFVAPDGTTYEGLGVPADVVIAYDAKEVQSSGVDPLLEKALHLIESGSFERLAAEAKRGVPLGSPSLCGRTTNAAKGAEQ